MASSEPEDTQIRSAHQQRMARLAADKQRILMQPPEKALDEILDHTQATALVHSMAEEDIYFLVHEIGVEDAMELLSLASNRQWEYLLDLEIWNRDRINTQALGHWMSLLSRADPPRFHQWTASEKYDLLEYYLHEALEIRIPEENEDPGDFPDGFFTHDGVFYISIQEGFLNAIEDEDDRDRRGVVPRALRGVRRRLGTCGDRFSRRGAFAAVARGAGAAALLHRRDAVGLSARPIARRATRGAPFSRVGGRSGGSGAGGGRGGSGG
ncbi:MAG: DUF6178 family protein, partial [Desulfosalsimonas sp.]|uniref:DUF6178 family protein n=1 Tax=Desulfosalsimonas sp. TaxID=3073848 RepID=UPI003970BBFF